MSATSKISVLPSASILYHLKTDEASAIMVSDLLQRNHERHHAYYHTMGAHNHIPHHLLTLYALDTTPDDLEKHYNRNAAYQRPKILPPTEASGVTDSGPFGTYSEALGFFLGKIDEFGVEAVILEFLLKENDNKATDLLEKLYMLHPLISVGFGLEFNQPSIVAEGLAMASVTNNRFGDYLSRAEKSGQSFDDSGRTMEEINEDIRQDAEIKSVRDACGPTEIPDKLFNGPVMKCPDKVIKYLSQWKVEADQEVVKRKLAELINCSARGVAGASNHPPKIIKFDFVQIHLLTGWYATNVLCQQPWMSVQNKSRLVEYQGRAEILFYLLSGVAGVNTEALETYSPKNRAGDEKKDWEDVLRRSTLIEDDGHSCKLIRTLALGRMVSKPYEGKNGNDFRIQGNDWIKIAYMAVDSLQPPRQRWVRFGGYENSWAAFPDRP